MTNSITTFHKKAVTAYRNGSRSRMVAALAASRVVGLYVDGLTSALATDLGVSVSQVENLSDAGMTYRALRPCCRQFGLNSELRRRLTPAHWAAAGRLQARYEIPTGELLSDMMVTAKDGISVESMRKHIKEQYDGDGDPSLSDILMAEYERLQKIVAREDARRVEKRIRRAMSELDAATAELIQKEATK